MVSFARHKVVRSGGLISSVGLHTILRDLDYRFLPPFVQLIYVIFDVNVTTKQRIAQIKNHKTSCMSIFIF